MLTKNFNTPTTCFISIRKKLIFIILTINCFSQSVLAETTIYLVRHAEKINSTDHNPKLTKRGQLRADNIAEQLATKGITHIYSTNYLRTMQTATPLAEKLKLEIIHYDPSQLNVFAQTLKNIVGKILVIGHSNTTPELTSLLSNQNIKSMNEDEYDKLFQVIINPAKTVVNTFTTSPSNSGNTNQQSR